MRKAAAGWAVALAVTGATVTGCLGTGENDDRDPGGSAKAPRNAPNVVVIQSDDQTLEMMRALPRTRRLIGERGATFTNHIANWPLCCPARATQLTGQYAHNHGVLGNAPPDGGYLRLSRHDNLAVWLKDAGYEVGHIGKFLNGYGPEEDSPETPRNEVTEVPPGWTDWRTGSAGTTYGYYDYVQNEWSRGDGGDREGTLVERGGKVRDYKSDADTAEALELIGGYARGERPFYLQVDYLAPHGGGPNKRANMPQPPYDCGGFAKPAPRHATAFDDEPLATLDDPSFNERDVSDKPPAIAGAARLSRREIRAQRAGYRCELESLLAVDEGVAAIVDRLRRAGELADTYLFFMSDNGFFHGEHRVVAGKNLPYEPAVHVPLLMRGPGVPPGVKVRGLTSNADFAPTVMALTGAGAGADTDIEPDGRSLIPPTERPDAESGRELLIEGGDYAAIRTERYKWISYEDGFVELYDLKRDPFEEANLADDTDYAQVRSRLSSRLAELRDCLGAECR